jgi:hypothetical protein
MAFFVPPRAQIEARKGAVATIYSGDLPEFPEWFNKELLDIMKRLEHDADAYRGQYVKGSPKCLPAAKTSSLETPPGRPGPLQRR